MPFRSDLLGLKNKYNCQIYLETGLYKITENSSINQALRCKFDKVYSIELEKKWIDYATPQLKKYIDENKCELIHDDSANMEKYILTNTDFNNKRVFFFLDAHVDNKDIKTPHKFKCPVIAELTAINKLQRKDHIICIDDMRIIRNRFPWGENKFDNYYGEMIKKLKEINENYKIDFIKGFVERDILIAYV